MNDERKNDYEVSRSRHRSSFIVHFVLEITNTRKRTSAKLPSTAGAETARLRGAVFTPCATARLCPVVLDRRAVRRRNWWVPRTARRVVVRITGKWSSAPTAEDARPTVDVEVVRRPRTSPRRIRRSRSTMTSTPRKSAAAVSLSDLLRPTLTRNLLLRHKMIFATRNYFDLLGFLVETPDLPHHPRVRATTYPQRVHKGSATCCAVAADLHAALHVV